MDSLNQLGIKAHQKGMWGDYKGAVAILSKAMVKHPFDKRLYNDRSYYYNKLKDFRSSLNDAEIMLQLFPAYERAYFRKGEVLMDVKKFEEAECVFRDLLKLAPDNKEANFYLFYCQISQLIKDRKFWVQDAKRGLLLNNNDTKQAKSFLERGGRGSLSYYDKNDIYYSDEEEGKPLAAKGKPVECRKPSQRQGVSVSLSDDGDYDPFMDPSNPFQSNALWVGNVTSKVTEQNLEPVFSKYGRIKSLFVQHNNSCAFINYMHPSMATNAMKNFPKKFPFEDTNLVIRFPDSSKTKNIPNYSSKSSHKK